MMGFYDNVIRLSFSDERHNTINPTRSRIFALVAWLCALYTLLSVVLIDIGGVSLPLPTAENRRSRLGNTGLEILQVRATMSYSYGVRRLQSNAVVQRRP